MITPEEVCRLAEQYGIARYRCDAFEIEFTGPLLPAPEATDDALPLQGGPVYNSALERLAGTARKDARS